MKKTYDNFNNFINKNISIPLLILSLFQVKPVCEFIYDITHKTGAYDTQGIGVITSSILAIATIYLAWIAFKSSLKANELSKLALESERPVIIVDYENETKSIILSNETSVDAVNVNIIYSDSSNECILFKDGKDFNISAGVTNFKLNVGVVDVNYSIVVIYSNPITGKIYHVGYEIDSGKEGTSQLTENSFIKYSKYKFLYSGFTSSFDVGDLIKFLVSS